MCGLTETSTSMFKTSGFRHVCQWGCVLCRKINVAWIGNNIFSPVLVWTHKETHKEAAIIQQKKEIENTGWRPVLLIFFGLRFKFNMNGYPLLCALSLYVSFLSKPITSKIFLLCVSHWNIAVETLASRQMRGHSINKT